MLNSSNKILTHKHLPENIKKLSTYINHNLLFVVKLSLYYFYGYDSITKD